MSSFLADETEEELLTLYIHKCDANKIEWLDEGKEMRYEGHLYDIAAKTETKDMIVIQCIDDTKEDALFSNLDNHINKHISPAHGEKKRSSSKKRMAVKFYYKPEPAFSFKFDNPTSYISFEPFLYSSAYVEIVSPPPEIA
jgi:hypothetical protein